MDRLPVDLLRLSDTPSLRVGAHYAAASRNVLAAALARRGVLLATTLLFLGLAMVAMALLERRYTAESILQLNFDKREDGAAEDRGSQVALDAGSIVQGELKIIRSRLIAQRVVERLHLADVSGGTGAPETTQDAGALPAGAAGTRALETRASPTGWGDTARGILRAIEGGPSVLGQDFAPTLAPSGSSPQAQRIEAAENNLLSHLSVDTDNRSYIITIRYVSTDPQLAARVANTVAEEYIHRRLEANFDAAGKMVQWFDGQIASATDQLRQAEGAVEAYRKQAGLLELGTSENLQQQQLRLLSAQLIAATAARGDAEAKLARVRSLLQGSGIASAADLQGSPQIGALLEHQASARRQLATLSATMGEHHPLALQAQAELGGISAALAGEMRRAVSILQGDVATNQAQERDLTQRLADAQHTIIAGKSGEAELRTEQAAVQGARDRLISLTRNRDQALAAQQLRFVAASLIVPAETVAWASFPRVSVVYPLALACALGMWLVLSALLERRDRGFVSSNEVEPTLGVRCVGMIPQDRPGGGGAAASLARVLVAEGVRSVAASLGLFATSRNGRVVLVTSSVRGEGKSEFCRCLADALTASGQRVLLMDRLPRAGAAAESVPWVPMAVGTAARAPVNASAPEQAATPDGRAGGDSPPRQWPRLVTGPGCGAGLPTREVFGTGELSRWLEEAQGEFDTVLLEGPAVLLIGDSLVLGRLADTVIHVARWSSTRQRTVMAALNRMQEASVGVDGVVLTGVDLRRHARMGLVDQCSHYMRDRAYYELLYGLRRGRQAAPRSEASFGS